MKRICVIGAGTVGLSVATRLIEEYGHENVHVDIVAEKFDNETTSFGSGGLWEPYQIAGTPSEKVNEWGKYAFDHFLALFYSSTPTAAGVQILTAYQLLEAGQDDAIPSWSSIVFNFQCLTAADIQKMGLPSKYVKGFTFGTLVIEQKYYMKYLTSNLKKNGVSFYQRKLDDIAELYDSGYDVVVNCSGLGAKLIAQDGEMYPIRGQVLRVKAPWINNVWFFGSSYIIPNVDTVVLGGTAQKGDWSTTVSQKDTDKIIDDISDIFPSIRSAPIENIWAGLRPGRAPLRLESERIPRHKSKSDKSELLVVHCYGHGGSGITLAMGCAQDVVTNHVIPFVRSPGTHNKNSTRLLSKL